jgi:hypothetical protein
MEWIKKEKRFWKDIIKTQVKGWRRGCRELATS